MEAPGLPRNEDNIQLFLAGGEESPVDKPAIVKHRLGKLLTSDAEIASICFPTVCPALQTPTSSASSSALLSLFPSGNPVASLSTAASPPSATPSPINNSDRTGLPAAAACTPSTCASQSSPHSVVSSLRASDEADLSPTTANSVLYSPLTSSATASRTNEPAQSCMGPYESEHDGVSRRRDAESVEQGFAAEVMGFREKGGTALRAPVDELCKGSAVPGFGSHETEEQGGGQNAEEIKQAISRGSSKGRNPSLPEEEVMKESWSLCEAATSRSEHSLGNDATVVDCPKDSQACELPSIDVSAPRASDSFTESVKQPDPSLTSSASSESPASAASDIALGYDSRLLESDASQGTCETLQESECLASALSLSSCAVPASDAASSDVTCSGGKNVEQLQSSLVVSAPSFSVLPSSTPNASPSAGSPLPEVLSSAPDVPLGPSSVRDLHSHEIQATDRSQRASSGNDSVTICDDAPNCHRESSTAPERQYGVSDDIDVSAGIHLPVDIPASRWSSFPSTGSEAVTPSSLSFPDSAVTTDSVSLPLSPSPSSVLRESKLRLRGAASPKPPVPAARAMFSFPGSPALRLESLATPGSRNCEETAFCMQGDPLVASSAPLDRCGMKAVLTPFSAKEASSPRSATGLGTTRSMSRRGAPESRHPLRAESPARDTAGQSGASASMSVKGERISSRVEKTPLSCSRRPVEGLFPGEDLQADNRSNEEADEVVRLHRLDVLRHSHDRTTVELYKLEKGRLVEELVRKAKKYPKVPGVYFDRYQQRWCVNWTEGGRRVARYYPVKVHGFHVAYQLAVNCMLSKKPLSATVAAGLAGISLARAGSAPPSPVTSTSPRDAHPSRLTPVNSPLHALRNREAAQRLATAASPGTKAERTSSSRRAANPRVPRNSEASPHVPPEAVEAMLGREAHGSLLGVAANQTGFPGDFGVRTQARPGLTPEALNSSLGALLLQQQLLLAANAGTSLGAGLPDLCNFTSRDCPDILSMWLHYQQLARLQQQHQQLAAFFSAMPAAFGVARNPLELSGAQKATPSVTLSQGISLPADPPAGPDVLSAGSATAPETGPYVDPSLLGLKGGEFSASALAALLAAVPGLQASNLGSFLPSLDVASGTFSGAPGQPSMSLESVLLAAARMRTAADAVPSAVTSQDGANLGERASLAGAGGLAPQEALQEGVASRQEQPESGAVHMESAGTPGMLENSGAIRTSQTGLSEGAASGSSAPASRLESVSRKVNLAAENVGDEPRHFESDSMMESTECKRRRRHSLTSSRVPLTSALPDSDMKEAYEGFGFVRDETDASVDGKQHKVTSSAAQSVQSGEASEALSLAQDKEPNSGLYECVSGGNACEQSGIPTDRETWKGSLLVGEDQVKGGTDETYESMATDTPGQRGSGTTCLAPHSTEEEVKGEMGAEETLDQPEGGSAYTTNSARSTKYVEDPSALRGKMLMDLTKQCLLPSKAFGLTSEQGVLRTTGAGGESSNDVRNQIETPEGVGLAEGASALALLATLRGSAQSESGLSGEALSKPLQVNSLRRQSRAGAAEQAIDTGGGAESEQASLDALVPSVYESEAYDAELDKLLTSQPAKDLVREALKMPRVPGVWFDRAQLRWACNYKDSSAFALAATSSSPAERLPGLAKRRAQYFPVKEHGFLRARLLAIQTRRRMESTYRQAAAAALASSLCKHDRTFLSGKERGRFVEAGPGMAVGRDEDAGESASHCLRSRSHGPKGANTKKRAGDVGAERSPGVGGRLDRRHSKKVETSASWAGSSHQPGVFPTASRTSVCTTSLEHRHPGGGCGAAATDTAASPDIALSTALFGGLHRGTASGVGALAGAEVGIEGVGEQAAALASLLAASSSLSDALVAGGVVGVGTGLTSDLSCLSEPTGTSPDTSAEVGVLHGPLLPEGVAFPPVSAAQGVESIPAALPKTGETNVECCLTATPPCLLSPSVQSPLLDSSFPPKVSPVEESASPVPDSNVHGTQLLAMQKDAIHYILEDLRHNCLSVFQTVLPPALFHAWSVHLIKHAQRVESAQTFAEVEPFLGVFVDCIRSKKMPSQLSPSVQLQLVRLASSLYDVLQTPESGTAVVLGQTAEEEASEANPELEREITKGEDVEATQEAGRVQGREAGDNGPTSGDGLESDVVSYPEEGARGRQGGGVMSLEPQQVKEGMLSRERVNQKQDVSLLNLALLSSLGGSLLTMPSSALPLPEQDVSPEAGAHVNDVAASVGVIKEVDTEPHVSSATHGVTPDTDGVFSSAFCSFLGRDGDEQARVSPRSEAVLGEAT
uniref:AP2 domain transcription factor AP2VIIb-3 n=1 Tax=Toxoplasma gondii COUG TaxID=1074873 RepID=A0A2G8Y8A8_TOXGO|nr:AP2 domain transcription factor AP2VIIb-3 [Toxoplasma gondii COUG]